MSVDRGSRCESDGTIASVRSSALRNPLVNARTRTPLPLLSMNSSRNRFDLRDAPKQNDGQMLPSAAIVPRQNTIRARKRPG